MEKLNCWQFKKCGREPNGSKVHELGICPAAVEKRLDGIHSGTNAGRACWVCSATLCKNEIQGSFAAKYASCTACDFYLNIREEEFPNFMLSAVILKRLEDQKATV